MRLDSEIEKQLLEFYLTLVFQLDLSYPSFSNHSSFGREMASYLMPLAT